MTSRVFPEGAPPDTITSIVKFLKFDLIRAPSREKADSIITDQSTPRRNYKARLGISKR